MSIEKQTVTIPEDHRGLRLDQSLARLFPDFSRSRLKDWLLKGAIEVNGGPKRPRDAVSGGEIVTFEPQPEAEVTAAPESIALAIEHEDANLLVINKPAGLVVHPGAGNLAGTLMNGLLHHAPELSEVPRAGIIHRLDKDTSGLLLVAKTLSAHTALVRLLADRDIGRHYLAVCRGALTGGGSIDEPIARHPVDRKRMSVQQDGKAAVTHFRIRERFASFTYVDVQLETGRTHQIRVHFAHRRHALVGDQTYGGRLALPKGASAGLIQTLRHFKRQALHAAKLTFTDPASGNVLTFMAEPPKDFLQLLDAIRDSDARHDD